MDAISYELLRDGLAAARQARRQIDATIADLEIALDSARAAAEPIGPTDEEGNRILAAFLRAQRT